MSDRTRRNRGGQGRPAADADVISTAPAGGAPMPTGDLPLPPPPPGAPQPSFMAPPALAGLGSYEERLEQAASMPPSPDAAAVPPPPPAPPMPPSGGIPAPPPPPAPSARPAAAGPEVSTRSRRRERAEDVAAPAAFAAPSDVAPDGPALPTMQMPAPPPMPTADIPAPPAMAMPAPPPMPAADIPAPPAMAMPAPPPMPSADFPAPPAMAMPAPPPMPSADIPAPPAMAMPAPPPMPAADIPAPPAMAMPAPPPMPAADIPAPPTLQTPAAPATDLPDGRAVMDGPPLPPMGDLPAPPPAAGHADLPVLDGPPLPPMGNLPPAPTQAAQSDAATPATYGDLSAPRSLAGDAELEPLDGPELPELSLPLPPPPAGLAGARPADQTQTAPVADLTPTPAPAAAAPVDAAPEQPEAVPMMIAYQGHLDMPSVHSICSLNLKPDYDEITPALAKFDMLRPGETGFIAMSVRPADGKIRGKLQEQLNQLQAAQPVGAQPMWKRAGKFLGQCLAYMMSDGKGKTPAPWDKDSKLKPPPRHAFSEEDNAMIDFAREKVQSDRFYEGRLDIGVVAPAATTKDRAEQLDTIVKEIQTEFNSSYSNPASHQGFAYRKANPVDVAIGLMPPTHSDNSVLSPPELGEMMKIPDSETQSTTFAPDFGKKMIAPRNPCIIDDPLNPPAGYLAFGEIFVGTAKHKVIGMPIKGLNTHMYLCGTTGSGKSTIMESFIYGLAKNGKSCFVIDPHGTLVDNSMKYILRYAPERAKDVLILDFGDTEWPVSFNPIAIDSQAEIEGTVNSVKEMILKMLNLNPDSAPRAVQYVEQCVWALCEANLRAFSAHKHLALTLLQVPTFFTDKEFRQLVMQFCTNLSIRETFDPEGPFEKLGERQQLDHVMPILRTFASLSTKDSFGNIFGQSESKIDFAKWVREKKLVMMKLPAIASDAAVATFIGAMVTPMLIGSLVKWGHEPDLAAYLLIDEFQNYATESYKHLLAQTRKHGLHGISANQVPQDLPADVLRGVQSNTQTKISMRLDSRAVKEVADFIASGSAYPRTDDIVALDNYWGWANVMMEGGKASGPFTFKGLPPMYDRDVPGVIDLVGEDRFAQGEENFRQLLPQVVNASRLASAEMRDAIIAKRQNHYKSARAVLERQVQEMARRGFYDGPTKSPGEEALDDFWGR